MELCDSAVAPVLLSAISVQIWEPGKGRRAAWLEVQICTVGCDSNRKRKLLIHIGG